MSEKNFSRGVVALASLFGLVLIPTEPAAGFMLFALAGGLCYYLYKYDKTH
jgi:hypothetical protein